MQKRERLLALDVMRGITIAAMILVNNPAVWGEAYAPLQHAVWHGMTPTDLIYPFFVFIMGISACFSLSKQTEGLTVSCFGKILQRTILIFAIGVLLQAISYFGYGTSRWLLGNAAEGSAYLKIAFPLATFRVMGVLQGLALAYLFGSLIAVGLKFRNLLVVSGVILAVYLVILQLGSGYELSADNVIAVVDRAILGEAHLYTERLPDGSRLAFEIESLLSTFTRVAQFLLGVCVGKILLSNADNSERLNKLFVLGVCVLFAGLLLQYGDPLNKKLWTSSFTLVTVGFGALLLGLLIWTIDIRKHVRWTTFFRVFGVNPLFLYVLAWVGSIGLNFSFQAGSSVLSAKGWFYTTLIDPCFGDASGSLVYALLYIGLIWCVGYVLYRKNIYIKI